MTSGAEAAGWRVAALSAATFLRPAGIWLGVLGVERKTDAIVTLATVPMNNLPRGNVLTTISLTDPAGRHLNNVSTKSLDDWTVNNDTACPASHRWDVVGGIQIE
jgi:hypothetical protein